MSNAQNTQTKAANVAKLEKKIRRIVDLENARQTAESMAQRLWEKMSQADRAEYAAGHGIDAETEFLADHFGDCRA